MVNTYLLKIKDIIVKKPNIKHVNKFYINKGYYFLVDRLVVLCNIITSVA